MLVVLAARNEVSEYILLLSEYCLSVHDNVVASIFSVYAGSGSFRTGLPKRGEEQEMSFRCIDEADRLVDYLRAKAVTLKAEGENSQKMIEENDKKLKRAEEERAALLREMERDRKLVAIFAGDRMKAEEFKYESVEMLNRLHQLLLLKGQQKPIEEVFAIVNSTMGKFII